MDLLRYSETVLTICVKDKPRREIHDILRQVFLVPTRIRLCPCVTDVWVRKTFLNLGGQFNNEPSH